MECDSVIRCRSERQKTARYVRNAFLSRRHLEVLVVLDLAGDHDRVRNAFGLHDQTNAVGQGHIGWRNRLLRHAQVIENVPRPAGQRLVRGRRNFVVLFGHLSARPRRAGVLRNGVGHDDTLVIEVASQHSVDVGDADSPILLDHIVRRSETLHGDSLTPLQSQAFDRVRIELELRNLTELGSLDEVGWNSGLRISIDDTTQLAIHGRGRHADRNGGKRNSNTYFGKGLGLKAGRQSLPRIGHASQIAASA